MKEFCVYRYRDNDTGKVVYIGKTDASLKARIDAHTKESGFIRFNGRLSIDYIVLSNYVETNILEKYLINYYKPELNIKDKTANLSINSIDPDSFTWISYEDYLHKRKKEDSPTKIKAFYKQQFLNAILSATNNCVYSSFAFTNGTLPVAEGNKKIVENEVFFNGEFFTQNISSDDIEFVYNHRREIEMFIWLPVWEESKKSEWAFTRYQTLYDLWEESERILEFQRNGFCQSVFGEPYEYWTNNKKEYWDYFSPLFAKHSEYDTKMIVEINMDTITHLSNIREKIASDIVILFKTCDIIPTDNDT